MENKRKEILLYYLLAMLPLKAILIQTVAFGNIFGLPNPSQAFNFFLILLNLIFNFIYLKDLLYNRYFFPLFVLILSLSFIALIQPIYSFYFTHKPYDFVWYLKLISWLLILPLSALAFNSKEDIFLLRKWGIVAFIIIIVGLLVGNIFKIGSTAYDLGIFYMGFWLTEAPLSITLIGFTPFFFLPKKSSKDKFFINQSGILLMFLNFFILCLVMKRSAILAFFISVIVTIYLFFRSKKIVFNFKHLFTSFALVIVIIFGSFSFIAITKPEALKLRTKDFSRAEKAGDIKLLGSGRLGLAEIYFQNFKDQPFSKKMLGIDFLGKIDKKNRGYLYTDIEMPPHNDYIDVLMSSGLLGLGLYFCFFLLSFIMVFRIYRIINDTILVYTSAVTMGMFVNYFIVALGGSFQSNLMLTGFMMLLGANIGIAQKIEKLPIKKRQEYQ